MLDVHVDVDNSWIWEQELSLRTPRSRDMLFDRALPEFLKMLDVRGMKATFFIVGMDLERESCRRFCAEASARGHELANHTFSHPLSFGRMSFAEKEREIVACDEALFAATGSRPVGFRSPGYYVDQDVVDILCARSYLYDTSTLPGWTTATLRGLFWATGRGGGRKTLGRLADVFAPTRPRRLASRSSSKGIAEFPIAVMPFTRLPVHFTFLYPLGMRYWSAASALLRMTQAGGAYLFHAIDFLDEPADAELARGMVALRTPFGERMEMASAVLDSIKAMGGGLRTTGAAVSGPRDDLL